MKRTLNLFFMLTLVVFFSAMAMSPRVVPGFYVEWPNHNGIPTMLEVGNRLECIHSPFQKIELYQTTQFGTMMVIDDVIMLTQRDNAGYHEMAAHVPLIAHPNPKKVLVVGGGDGGTITQVLKHSSVREVVLCEIDQTVIDLSKKYFPEFAPSFDNPRVTIVVEDAAHYIKTQKDQFDVICVDSTDPFGPGEALFTEEFYKDIAAALTKDGIAVTQSESMFLYTDLIAKLYAYNRAMFAYASYYYTVVPTYPGGTIGFSFCSKKHNPFDHIDAQRIAALGALDYYNEGMHRASFQLPQFLIDRLVTG